MSGEHTHSLRVSQQENAEQICNLVGKNHEFLYGMTFCRVESVSVATLDNSPLEYVSIATLLSTRI